MGAEQSTALPAPSSQPGTPSANQTAKQPRALIVCGPSGVGKKSLINLLLERNPGKYEVCVSHTTRNPRPKEMVRSITVMYYPTAAVSHI
jgi:septin family protein